MPVLAAASSLPNIVVILADDMGYGDVAHLNSESPIPTPNLDGLASESMSFTDAHSPSSVCTPTRYGLLTGRYAWRTRLKQGVLTSTSLPLIESGRLTLGSLLQQSGYRTAIFGKWHLGLGLTRNGGQIDFTQGVSDGPHTHGFDESLVISNWRPPYFWVRGGDVTGLPFGQQEASRFPRALAAGAKGSDFDPGTVLDTVGGKATDFIAEQADAEQPFFLYLPLTSPHKPVWPADRFVGRTAIGPYGDFIVHTDAIVGDVLDAIDEAGVRDTTLVFFTSDNGSFMYRRDVSRLDHTDNPQIQAYRETTHTANYVYRGTKADIWEGGHRVPFIVRWPGTIASGSEQSETICLTDILATIAEIVGTELPDDAGEDSFSLLPLLRGETPETSRPPVIHHSHRGMFAIREGRWKLVAGNGSGGRERPQGSAFGRPFELYDLEADLSETENVYDQHPGVAGRLEDLLEQIRSRGTSHNLVTLSSEATLSSLALTGVDIGTFAPRMTNYAATVGHEVASTTVTVAAADAGASFVIADPSGSTAGASRTVALEVGANAIAVTVTAADGTTTTTYAVTVTREGAPVTATFASVPRSHDGETNIEMELHFSEAVRVSKRTLNEVALRVSGGTVMSSTRLTAFSNLGWKIAIRPAGVDDVTVSLVAVAECDVLGAICTHDGRKLSNRPEATVSGPQPSSDATLSSLALTGVDIGAFVAGTTSYAAAVGHEVASTTVTAAASDAGASYEIADATGSTAGASRTAALEVGTNTITVTVTAADGTTTLAYSVTVTRERSSEATPLTAEFRSVPARHDGNAFQLQLHFSEDVRLSYRTVRDVLLQAVGGQVVRARRLQRGSNMGWDVRVLPSGTDDVSLTLAAASDCDAPAAVCTSDGRMLSNRPTVTVAGPDGAEKKEPAAGDVRLRGGANAMEGRVEVYYEKWGPVCDDYWDINNAKVVCRQLGYGDALEATVQARFGESTGPIQMDNVECTGAEERLASCGFNGWAQSNCNRSESAGVVCAVAAESPQATPDFSSKANWLSLPRAATNDSVALSTLVDLALEGRPPQTQTELDLSHAKQADLPDLERLGNLRRLALRGNRIADLSSLASLERLEELNLSDNEVVDLRPLAGLSSLRRLDLRDNRIVDLQPLAGLPLEELRLDGNLVVDLWPLTGLQRLKRLELARNRISELGALAGLAPPGRDGSLRHLTLRGNRIAELAPVAALKGLRELDLRENEVAALEALAGLSALRRLDLRDNRIARLSALAGLALEDLRLDGNKVADLWPLARLQRLIRLDLGRNGVTDLRALGGLARLGWLDLSGNAVSNLSPLSGLQRLEVLLMADNAVTDAGPLLTLNALRLLDVRGNSVTGLEALGALADAVVKADAEIDGAEEAPRK